MSAGIVIYKCKHLHLSFNTPNIELACLSTVKPISLGVLPFRHKRHTFCFSILFSPRFDRLIITTYYLTTGLIIYKVLH